MSNREAVHKYQQTDKGRLQKTEYYQKNRTRIRSRQQAWTRANKWRYKAIYKFNRMRAQYGLTPEEYKNLWEIQQGKCSLPSCPNGAECIDHDHESLMIRGLLCRPCNLALGNFRDNPALMREGALYIEASKDIN